MMRIKRLAKELFKWCDDYEYTGIGMDAFEEDAVVATDYGNNLGVDYVARNLIEKCGYKNDISECPKKWLCEIKMICVDAFASRVI